MGKEDREEGEGSHAGVETFEKSGVSMRMSHWNLGGRATRKSYQPVWGQGACRVHSRVP